MAVRDLLLDMLLRAALIPAAGALCVWLVGLWLNRRSPGRSLVLAAGLALAVAVACAYGVPRGIPWRPAKSWEWFPFIAILGAAVAWVESSANWPGWSGWRRWGAWGACVGTAAWLTIPALPFMKSTRIPWVVGSAILMLAVWHVLRKVSRRIADRLLGHTQSDDSRGGQVSDAPPALLLAFAAAVAGMIVELTGFSTLARLELSLSSVLALCGIASWLPQFPPLKPQSPPLNKGGPGGVALSQIASLLPPHRPMFPGLIPGFSMLWVGMLTNAYLYHSGAVPWSSFLLIGLSPLSLLALAPPRHERPPGRWGTIAGYALGLLVPLAALGLALWKTKPWEGEY
ncbi:MAG: hypothetical protein ACKV0T_19970 [Planctomycetales bacterium]